MLREIGGRKPHRMGFPFWLSEIELRIGEKNMEPLALALAVLYKRYTDRDTFVPEPAEFRPFDLRALKRPYEVEANSSSRPSDRGNAFVTQAAS